MILTKDSVPGNTFHEIRDQLEQLLQFVDKAAQDAIPLYDVERRVFDGVLKLGHQCVEVFIGLQGNGDLGKRRLMIIEPCTVPRHLIRAICGPFLASMSLSNSSIRVVPIAKSSSSRWTPEWDYLAISIRT